MSGSAQREWTERADGEGPAGDLKRLAAERLAAHRGRRSVAEARQAQAAQVAEQDAQAASTHRELGPDASRVREAVAERYRQRQSYREYLAAQAERAVEQAQAEVEVAERKARAVAEAQVQLMAEIERWEMDAPAPLPSLVPMAVAMPLPVQPAAPAPPVSTPAPPAFEPPVFEPIEQLQDVAPMAEMAAAAVEDATPSFWAEPPATEVLHAPELWVGDTTPEIAELDREPSHNFDHDFHPEERGELEELEEEIAFRREPRFVEHHLEPLTIPANLVEFPRQLVATRRVRPRLAEGPLRELAATGVEEPPQLRIFEVEPEQISATPEVAPAEAAPEWQRMVLDREVVPAEPLFELDADGRPLPGLLAPIYPCGMERRLLGGLFDLGCVAVAALAFACVFVACAAPGGMLLPQWLAARPSLQLPVLAATALAVYAGCFALYQVLFLTLGEATPGMLYARIGLCTFADASPTRSERKQRVRATLLAMLPLGMGVLRMAVDIDHLGWHDNRSRTYLREY